MDSGESENAKKEPGGGGGKKGKAGDQPAGKEAKKSGKAERQKGAQKAKDSQQSWVKKADADGSEAQPEEQPEEGRKGRAKAKVKGDGKGDGKKDSWKDRRGKQQDVAATGDNDAGKGKGKQRGKAGNGDANADKSLPSGGALLSMLKANPPSVTRYTREELLFIGQLPASKVKPMTLNMVIDKENHDSPLLVQPKADRASRRNRGDGEEDGDDENDGAGRRERRQRGERTRRGENDLEEEGNRRRDRNQWDEERQRPQWWKEELQPHGGKGKDFGKGGHYQQDHSRDAGGLRATPDAGDAWAMPSAGKGDDMWDMPDTANDGNTMDFFTLGDIKQAEKSFNKGMSMSDYKASLQKDNHRSEPLEGPRGKDRSGKDESRGSRDVMFGGNSGFFVEEDEEDVAQASRGFGKWFGRGAEAGKGKGNGKDEEELWDMPQATASSAMALPPGMVSQDKSKPSPAVSSQQHRPLTQQEPRSPEAHPLGFSSIERLLEESPSSKRESEGEGLNPLGKSILSMLEMGRADSSTGEPSLAEGLDPGKQGKLSVAELFNLAQGKELPSMPLMNSNQKGGGDDQNAEQKMQREVLARTMAQQMMWMQAAAKGGQPGMPPGSRFPGYQQPSPYGAMGPAAALGMSHPGTANPATMMGQSAQERQLYAEAYAQAMGLGRGGFAGGKGGQKAAQAGWPSPMGPMGAYPYPRGTVGPGYGSQAYGGYPMPQPDYAHFSSRTGNMPPGAAQPAAMHRASAVNAADFNAVRGTKLEADAAEAGAVDEAGDCSQS